MKNINELVNDYNDFMRRFNELDVRITDIVRKEKEIQRDPLFFYLECPEEFEYWKDSDENWQMCNKELLQKKYEVYQKSIEKAIIERNELFEEKYTISVEYNDWYNKNDIHWGDFKGHDLVKRDIIIWRGWDSSRYVYESMIYSINLTDEEEVNKIIENMQKVIAMINSDDDFGGCRSEEYVDYLRIVNNETRHRLDEGCMSTLALDLMENDCIYNSFKESFKECILNVSRMVDGDYMSYVHYLNRYKK